MTHSFPTRRSSDLCRLIELRKVAAKVGFRERLHRIVGVLETALHTLQPPEFDHRWLHNSAGLVEPVEGAARDVAEHLRPVGHHVGANAVRSEEHTSELQSLMRISYAVFCLKKKKRTSTPPNKLLT